MVLLKAPLCLGRGGDDGDRAAAEAARCGPGVAVFSACRRKGAEARAANGGRDGDCGSWRGAVGRIGFTALDWGDARQYERTFVPWKFYRTWPVGSQVYYRYREPAKFHQHIQE